MNTQSTDPNWTPIIPTQEQYDEMRYVSILKSRWTRTSQQLPFSDDSSSLILKCRQFVSGNVGLLLVASAQLFFSLMNLGVKVVSTIDPPVHTLEVSRSDFTRVELLMIVSQLIILRMVKILH